MKLLVTGGLGFIGSNFIIHVLKNYNDFEIINLDAEIDGSNHDNLKDLEKSERYRFVKGNITNRKLLDEIIPDVDCVINFAAESHVDRSIADPNPFLISNFRGVFTILEALKDKKKKFIQISTDEVFGTIKEGSATEVTRFNPSSPYAATKASAELLINAYIVTYKIDAMITRCTNNYGPRQFFEKLIPKTISLSTNDKTIPIYGNGKSIRDWIYVDDHCKAIMLVLKNGKSGESYNISAVNEIYNLQVVSGILKILDKSEKLMKFVSSRPGEDTRYSLDSTKIRRELGWEPEISFDEGIKKTIEWYQTNKDWGADTSNEVFSETPWRNKD
jgi:dTDP-glucose 4,6-dehydratase